ncbi:RNA-directed DNA polymerase, eukaryota [Tanacetum coccineum]
MFKLLQIGLRGLIFLIQPSARDFLERCAVLWLMRSYPIPNLPVLDAKRRSWFSILKQADNNFVNNERIIWVSVEGLLVKAWTHNSFRKIASIWGELVEWEDDERTSFSCKNLCLKTKMDVVINDKRKIITHGIAYWIRVKEFDAWVPDFEDDDDSLSSGEDAPIFNNDIEDIKVDKVSEMSFIQEFDHVLNSVHDEAPQSKAAEALPNEETTAYGDLSWHIWKLKWRISTFVLSRRFGATCILFTWLGLRLDSLVIPSSTRLLVISIYAPQELSEKRDLWNYLQSFISRWDGETVLMGDFNEVRSERERFGYVFNQQGATAFNQFISSSSLIDPPLDGYAFTWSHKNASKMSKLDRFFLSEGLFDFFPHLSTICLDKNLGDHRPISFVNSALDYGPTPLSKQFSSPPSSYICLDYEFPVRLTSDQVEDLESEISNEEVKGCLGLRLSKRFLLMVASLEDAIPLLLLSFRRFKMPNLWISKGPLTPFNGTILDGSHGILMEWNDSEEIFFNGHDGFARKSSWFNWNKALASKKIEGIGVSSFFVINRALLFIWVLALLFRMARRCGSTFHQSFVWLSMEYWALVKPNRRSHWSDSPSAVNSLTKR